MLVFENSGYQLLAQEYRHTVCKNFTALLNDDKKLNALFMGMPFSETGAGLEYYYYLLSVWIPFISKN